MTQQQPALDPQALLAHRDFVRGIARSLLFDEHAADDVVQQTWLAALGADAPASRGWLGAVARNIAVKRLRGDRRRVAREAAVARQEGVPSDEDVRERERLRREVVDAVLALAEPYRGTILLRYFEGLPPREVAARMGVPVETVRTRTRRAVELLRVRLDGRHAGERRAFCTALLAWAGPRESGGAATVAGGAIVGMKAVAAGAAVLAAGLGVWLLWPREGAPQAPAADGREVAAAPASRRGSDAAPAPRKAAVSEDTRDTSTAAAPAASTAPAPLVVGGRVSFEDGTPVARTEVWISTGEAQAEQIFIVMTGDDGRFERTMETAAECKVRMSQSSTDPRFTLKSAEPQRATPPRKDVDFVGTRLPTATIVVSVFDLDTGRQVVEQFSVATPGTVSKLWPKPSGGNVPMLVRLASPAGATVRVAVTVGDSKAEREVALRENERVEVRIDLSRGGAVAGRVTDVSGSPVANALVFFGEEHVGRGDEPFKPFDERRVSGARTDADGRFELRGKGRWVTVWHPDASLATLPAGNAAAVVLQPRGTVRGVLRGADGAPLAATKVFLDRVRETTTDADGRFTFDKVEAGTRGLSLTGGKPKGYVAVRVAPGETTDVDLRPGLPSVRVTWPGRTAFGRFVGFVPLGAVGSLAIGQSKDDVLTVADVLPGRYLLIAEGGAIATVDVSGPAATAVVGTGEIVVRAKPKTRLFVVPAESGYLARLLAGRQAGAGVPADGVQRFSGLAAGRYDVGVELDGVRATVEVKDAPVEVTISEP